jgi:hypothetical protein
VSRALSLVPRAAEALLGALTALGFLSQLQGRFHLTEVASNFLLPESPYYWGGFLRRFREFPVTSAALRDALKRGATEVAGAATGLWIEQDRERLRVFTDAMHSHSFALAAAFARRFDGSGLRKILDVGGGSGCFCIALASCFPELHCTVMDLPIVCEFAREYVEGNLFQGRIDTHPADMFNSTWPTGYDAVFFSDIFHDWDDDRCRDLAHRSFEILPRGGRILVHEMLLNDTMDGPLPAVSYSIAMMFSTLGRQRSAGAIALILQGAGFAEISMMPSSGYYSLVTGKKI